MRPIFQVISNAHSLNYLYRIDENGPNCLQINITRRKGNINWCIGQELTNPPDASQLLHMGRFGGIIRIKR